MRPPSLCAILAAREATCDESVGVGSVAAPRTGSRELSRKHKGGVTLSASSVRSNPAPVIGSRTEPFIESVIREMTRLGAEAGAINLSQGVPDFDSPRR